MMKKGKRIGLILIVFVILAGVAAGLFISKNWTLRFKSELDAFFGKGNWRCVSQETKKSRTKKKANLRSLRSLRSYQSWDIKFTNRNGEEEIWSITNYTLKLNHDKYGVFSPKRYSSKQALTLELMNISFGAAGEEVKKEMIRSELSEEEAECLEVEISYHGGNPKPDFYDKLWKEDWFAVNEVSAGDYLSCDLHDFYIHIKAYDYKLEKLTKAQQQHVFDSMEAFERKIIEKYGDNVSFEIYFNKEHYVEYIDGIKQ